MGEISQGLFRESVFLIKANPKIASAGVDQLEPMRVGRREGHPLFRSVPRCLFLNARLAGTRMPAETPSVWLPRKHRESPAWAGWTIKTGKIVKDTVSALEAYTLGARPTGK